MAYVKYDGSFKDLWELRNTDVSCFKSSALKGKTTWQDSGKLLRLDDSTWAAKGGYITFTVGSGWKVALRIATENVDYFQDEIDPQYLIDAGKFSDGKFPDFPSDEADVVAWEASKGILGENDSELFVMLNAGDILLIDVDADHGPGEKAFRIRKDGKEYIMDYNKSTFGIGSVRTNEDTFIRMLDAYYFVEDLPATGDSSDADEGDGDVSIPVDINDEVVVEDEDIENPIKNPDKDPDNPQDSFKDDLVIDPTDGGSGDQGGNGGGGGDGGDSGDVTEEDKTVRNLIFIAIMGVLAFMVVRVVSMNGGRESGE